MNIAIGTLFSEDQRVLEELDLLPEDSDEEELEAEPSSSALAPALDTSSSVIVPSFGNSPDVTRSFRRGTAGGIPWFEEMVEGSRLGRLMRGRRGMAVNDDQSTSFEWEISEWHDDGTGGTQDDSDSNSHPTGKRKRGQQLEAKSKSKRA